MSQLPYQTVLHSDHIPNTIADLASIQRLLLEKVFASAALRVLLTHPDAIAAVVLCEARYNDEGFTYLASVVPARSLPDLRDGRSLCGYLYNALRRDDGEEEDEDDVCDRWAELMSAHALSLPDSIVSVMLDGEREGLHALAVFLRGDGPQEIRLQRLVSTRLGG